MVPTAPIFVVTDGQINYYLDFLLRSRMTGINAADVFVCWIRRIE